MHSTRKLFATTMIAAAGAVTAALAFSGTAAAQPAAPAPAPGLPGLPFIQQLASNPAAASQLMQGFTSLLSTAASPPGRSGHTSADRDRVGHPSAAAGSAARCRRSAQHTGRTRDRPGQPAAAGSVDPERSGLVDTRRYAVGRSVARGDFGGRTCAASRIPRCSRAAAPAAAAPAAAAPAALPTAGIAPMMIPLSALP